MPGMASGSAALQMAPPTGNPGCMWEIWPIGGRSLGPPGARGGTEITATGKKLLGKGKPRAEGLPRDAQDLGGLGLVSSDLPEHRGYIGAFHFGERLGIQRGDVKRAARLRRLFPLNLGRQVVGQNHVIVLEDGDSLYPVSQFPNVPGPGVLQ